MTFRSDPTDSKPRSHAISNPRVLAGIPHAVREFRNGSADSPTQAVEKTIPNLPPSHRADAALVVEKAAEEGDA
jgi:hypothetical protein